MQPVADTSPLKIRTPALQVRETSKWRLDNGLQVLLISDPGLDKSGAALCVEVGQWNDPKEAPGMAHFCEHLLFLGTAKYPEENFFHRYLTEHGGNFNAMTQADRTTYGFSIDHPFFDGALDRFAAFFHEPLFNASGVARERHAVDEEFSKNLLSDGYRAMLVLRLLSNPEHPYSALGSGNAQTLANVTREQVQQWYKRHYSSDGMQLVVMSTLPMEQMRQAVEQRFNQVAKQPPFTTPTAPFFQEKYHGTMAFLETIKDIRDLELVWEVPRGIAEDHDAQVGSLLSYLLGHEGEGSLLSMLKAKGLAEGLSTGAIDFSPTTQLLAVHVALTPKGLEHRNEVLRACFEEIALLKRDGYPSYLYDEMKQMAELRYAYQARGDVFGRVLDQAGSMTREKLETFPSTTVRPSEFKPKQVQQLLEAMSPLTAVYLVQAPAKELGITLDRKEPWSGARYALKPVATAELEAWSRVQPSPELRMPSPNPYLPGPVEPLYAVEETGNHIPTPERIADTPWGQAYFAPDKRYGAPTVSCRCIIKTPSWPAREVRQAALFDLYVRSAQEQLNTLLYTARLAGLDVSIHSTHRGLEWSLDGYAPKASQLVGHLMQGLLKVHPTPEQFQIYKESLISQCQSKAKDAPLSQARALGASLLYRPAFLPLDEAEALKTISYNDFIAFCERATQPGYAQLMIYGQLTRDDALQLWQNVSSSWRSNPHRVEDHLHRQVALLSEDGPMYVTQKQKLEGTGVLLVIDQGEFSFERRAAQQLLAKALEEPLFSQLRTQQQTAYLVRDWAEETERHLYTYAAIQSANYDGRDLLARIELAIEQFLRGLGDNYKPEQFERIRQAAVTGLEQPPQNPEAMADTLSLYAFEYDGDFAWRDKRIQALRNLSFQQWVQLSREMAGRANRRRLAILIEGPPAGSAFSYTRRAMQPLRKGISYTAKGVTR